MHWRVNPHQIATKSCPDGLMAQTEPQNWQAAGCRPSNAKRHSRTEDHCTRCARIQFIPVPLKWRATLTQMAAVATGCYAAECNPIPRGQLRIMRAAAFRAAWRNTFRCAPEIAFALFLPWRADPVAVAVILPLLYCHHYLPTVLQRLAGGAR